MCLQRCHAQFTRSDLLTRHRRTCCDSYALGTGLSPGASDQLMTRRSANRSRRKSCQSCADSKVKCDLQQPCSKCKARGRECVYVNTTGRKGKGKVADAAADSSSPSSASPSQDSPADASGSKSPETDSTKTTPNTEFSMPSTFFDGISPLTSVESSQSPFDLLSKETSTFTSQSTSVAVSSTSAAQVAPLSSSDNAGTLIVAGASHNEEERGYLSDIFSSEMYDNLFTDLFTSSFEKNPSVPGQHFQQDPTTILTDRLEGTAIDHAMIGAFVDPSVPTGPAQLAMYTVPSTLPLPYDPMASIPESEILGYSTSPAQTMSLMGMPSIAEYYGYSECPSFTAPTRQPAFGEVLTIYVLVTEFLTSFSQHMPIVHLPTFLKEARHPLLVKASKACGAMYANTPNASRFIETMLATCRDEIIAELVSTLSWRTCSLLTRFVSSHIRRILTL